MVRGMTKKIGISLREELYDWAAREVEEGRAESVSALIAEGLELLKARAQLEALVNDLRGDIGELDDQTKARAGDELTAGHAREIGVTIGRTSHPDIADVHVALAAAERRHAVLTSDDAWPGAPGLSAYEHRGRR
jgi:Arc/MetJ-type ribon-helix-helix transcriptional regulator